MEGSGPFAVTQGNPAGELHGELAERHLVLLGNDLYLAVEEVLDTLDKGQFLRICILQAVDSAVQFPLVHTQNLPVWVVFSKFIDFSCEKPKKM